MAQSLLNDCVMSTTSSPFFQLLSEAEKIEIKEVQDPPLTPSGEKVFVVKIQPPAKSPFQRTDQEIVSEAQLLLQNKDYLLARNCFSYLLRKNLKDQTAMEGLGECFFNLREFDSAKKCFKALWELHQKDTYAIKLGLCFLEEGNSAGAESAFLKVKSPHQIESPLRFEFEKAWGNIWMERKQWEMAEQHYQNALQLLPDSVAVEVNLGTLYLNKKDQEKARAAFNRALKLEPSSSKALCGLALISIEEKNPSEACSLLKRSIEGDPQNSLALLCLSQMTLDQKEKNQLIEQLREFLQKEPHQGEIRFQLARLLMEQKRFNESYEEADRAIKSLPGDLRIINLKKILIQNRHRGQA